MANTTNLNLVKPAGTDKALVSVLNSNSDKIDAWAGTTNQALLNHDLGSFSTLGALETALKTYIDSLPVGAERYVGFAFTAVAIPFSDTTYFANVKRAQNGNHLCEARTVLTNNIITGRYRTSTGNWYWEETVVKSEVLFTPTLILEQSPTTSGENTYDCNWAIYKVLIIAIGNYGNTYTTITIPTSEFGLTANGHAIFISYGGGSAWTIYKNGASGVKIIAPSSIQANTRIRIWGM